MPTYPRKCLRCQHRFTCYAQSFATRVTTCPECGSESDMDAGEVKFKTEKTFYGADSVSRFYSFHPDEVEDARRRFADTGARIDDGGRVIIENSKVGKAFRAAYKERVTGEVGPQARPKSKRPRPHERRKRPRRREVIRL